MRKSRGTSYAVIAAAACAAIAAQSHAATITWNGATPPPAGNWTDAANWSGGVVPVAADNVVFGNVGAADAAGTVTNVISADTTLAGLLSEQQADLTDGAEPPTPTPKFHTMQIDPGVTLTLNGNPSTGILHIGSRTNAATAFSVHTTFTGGGSLTLNNGSATADIRQGSVAGSFSGRSTLDLSGLSNFNATVANFRIGNGEGSSTNFNRAAGTVILAPNSTITAGTVITGFVSASSGPASQLTLNTNTTINANNFQFGIRKGNGSANFAAGVTDGSLIVRNQAGTGRANLEIAQAQASENTNTNANGTLDFTFADGVRGSGSVDMLLGNLLIARGNAAAGTATQGRGTGRLTYDAGIVDANDVVVGEAGNVNGKGTSIGTLEVKGSGQLVVNNNLTLARNTVNATGTGIPTGTLTIGNAGATASARITGNLIDGGGTTTVNVISGSLSAATIGSAASPIDTFNLTDGKLTVNLDTAAATANITALTADGTNKLGVNVTGAVTPGIYPVVDYGTIGGVGAASITVDKLPARMVATLQDSGSTLDLNVTSFDSPKWVGNIDSTWNFAIQNWQLINAGTATAYEENLAVYSTGDNVLFDSTAVTGTVNLASTVSPGSIRFQGDALNYNVGGAGAIVGSVPIIKEGGHTAALANTGGNAVGPITINGGRFQIGTSDTAGSGAGTYASAAVASGATLDFAPGAGAEVSIGLISGAGAVAHSGPGTTTFAAANSYTGSTNITAGTVMVTNNNTFGPITAGSAEVNISGTGAIDLATAATNLDFGTNKLFNVGGHGTDNNGAIVNSGTNAIQNAFEKIQLTADATINLNARVDIRGTDAVRGWLNLNGQTLTKKGPGQFTIVRSDVTDGNINVLQGTLRFETSSTAIGGGLFSFAPGSTAQFQQVTGEITRPIALDTAIVSDSNQTHASTIQSPITLTGVNDFAITNSTGFTFSGNISGAGGMSKSGGGTMHLTGQSSFTGKLAAVDGKLNLETSQSGSSALEAGGDAVIELTDDTTANKVIHTGDVAITDTARVDIKNNKLLTLKPAGNFDGTAYTGLQGDIQRAYNFGAWDQPGLTTSMPEAGQNAGPLSNTTTIAVATASQVLFIEPTDTAVFQGQTVTGATTIAMYTYAGDLNLDGLIDGADYGTIDNSVQFPGTDGYVNGDFNYDGVIDGADYGIIDNAIQFQGAPFPGVVFGASGASSASLSGVTAVPEPSACGLAIVAGAAMLGRRRRRAGQSAATGVN